MIEDRIEKEKLRRQAEQEEEELKATINVRVNLVNVCTWGLEIKAVLPATVAFSF